VYDRFIEKAQTKGIGFVNDGKWKDLDFSIKAFEASVLAAISVRSLRLPQP
jgi:hypothetical protein